MTGKETDVKKSSSGSASFSSARELRQRYRELALINHASQAFSSSLELDQVLQTILDEMHLLMDIVGASFWLRLPETGQLVCQQATGPASKELIGMRLAPGQGFTGIAAQTGTPQIIADTRTDARYYKPVTEKVGIEVRSLINIPLRAKGEVIGVLNLTDTRVNRFSSDDLRLLEPIATVAASTVQNARLFNEAQHQRQIAEQRVKELSILNHITQTLATLTNHQTALEFVAKAITQCFSAYSVSISLFNEARTTRTITAFYQTENAAKLNLIGREISIVNDGTYAEFISQGQSIIIPNPQTSPHTRASHKSIKERNLQCLMLIPLQTRGDIIGTISISTQQVERAFTVAEVTLAETIARQIAGAMEVTRLFDEEQHQRQLAETRNQELDAFAKTVAHDLKGPLGNIIGFAGLLEEGGNSDSAEQQEFIQYIKQSADKAINIINELLLLAGVRKQTVQLEPIDTGKIVEQAQFRLKLVLAEYQGHLIMPKQWPAAKGYAPWIEEVWVNYISNGLKYGGRPPVIELGATPLPNGFIRFWVKDNGEGLTLAAQSALFTEFTRLNKARAEGHGLGLSIVHRIIGKLGGQVGVESTTSQGSTFYFTLPQVDE